MHKAVSLCTLKLLVVAILGQCLHGELFWNVYAVFRNLFIKHLVPCGCGFPHWQ